ncbi:unnamed protein product [Knipowitschia caucasica]
MVESNVTLEGQTILTILQNITGLKVQDGTTSYDVVINQTESVGECLVVGLETSCNCSEGYIWSNEVCYNYNCCRELTCNQNVSYLSPLCIPKVKIYVNGSVTMNEEEWASGHESILKSELERLNGYDSLNVTRSSSPVTFEVEYSVVFKTSTLQDVVDTLQTKLKAFISVQTLGMVEITPPPEEEVCYESYPYLKCTFGEATDRAGWNMSTTDKRFELNDGTVVKLNYYCTTREFPSCVAVTLQKVTGSWEGTYECGFSKGLVRHTAKAYLKVARLPDSILVTAEPITGDCSEKGSIESIPINVTATILNTTSSNTYKFTWKYNTMTGTAVSPHGDGKNLNYKFLVQMSCVKVPDAQIIFVQFENTLNQTKNSSVTVPVIYAGEKFCIEDSSNGDIWPKTPSGDTAVSTICPPGRVGYKERTCKGSVWEKVYDVCINEKLSEVSNAADDFLKGLGATEDVALDIFSELSTTSGGADGGDNIADVIASLYVLDVMAQASNVKMTEKVIPDLAKAASDMLNKTWEGKVNTSIIHSMSANYLVSLEGLVKNIAVNTSSNTSEYNTTNLDLKYCQGEDCEVEVFGINVSMKNPGGLVKTVAVKNLMHRLRNTFKSSDNTDLLLSATMDKSNSHELSIEMQFPATPKDKKKPHCVFWDVKEQNWNDTGCKVVNNASNTSGIFCQCNHLTSFSVLMAREDVSNPVLDIITYVGLAISIVSLVIFLIIEYLVWSAVVKTKLSHYRHTCMVNIAFFLLLADICFLASVDPPSLSPDACLFFTICKHLFYLAKFSWMLCLSGMLVHQLIFVFNPLRKKVFMYFSSIVGYIIPILIVGSSYVYYRYTNKPYYGKETCWLTYERLLVGSLHSFLLPIGTILLSNIFSMTVVIVTLFKSSQNDSSKKDEKDTAKSIIKVILILAPVFGVTWSIGFYLVLYNRTDPLYEFFNYTFTIVNSFQGLFVLLTGFASEKKVKDELYKIVFGKKGSSDSTKNPTSTMYTKDK